MGHLSAKMLRTAVSRHANPESLEVFVETGTNRGGTILYCAGVLPISHTIEASRALFNMMTGKLRKCAGLTTHLGDTLKVLPKLLSQYQQPIVFFLDAHMCKDAKAYRDPTGAFPIFRELALIKPRLVADIVIVDDARVFGKRVDRGIPGEEKWEGVTAQAIREALGSETVNQTFTAEDHFFAYRTDRIAEQTAAIL